MVTLGSATTHTLAGTTAVALLGWALTVGVVSVTTGGALRSQLLVLLVSRVVAIAVMTSLEPIVAIAMAVALVMLLEPLTRQVMIVHVPRASVLIVTSHAATSVAARRVLILFQLGQLTCSFKFEVNGFLACLVVKDIFNFASVLRLHIEDSALVVLEAAHSFDVLGDGLG